MMASRKKPEDEPYGDPIDSPPDAGCQEFTIAGDGVRFLSIPSSFRQITEIPEYVFTDIRPDDKVLDIGANVGAFCIRASRYSPHVTAVEPLTAHILRKNIEINGAPVRVLEGALGDGSSSSVCWDDCRATIRTWPLREIIRQAGGCTFLKCDCEGAEWLIDPRDLAGIRRIEMELHLPPISGPPAPRLLDYLSSNFAIEIERKPVHTTLGVMGVLHAKRRQ